MCNDLKPEQIRACLADEITNGEIPAGEVLNEQQLAARFGTSRTPVREALRWLTVAGLAEQRTRRGTVVVGVTTKEILEMFETTAIIEAACVELATIRMTLDELANIQSIHDQSLLIPLDDYGAYAEYNMEWHQALYHAARNSYLAKSAIDLMVRVGAYRRTQLRFTNRPEHSRAEHGEIMTAISNRDADRAAMLMRKHILHGATAFGRYLTLQRLNSPQAASSIDGSNS
jgi:DNA-binding GntR family transcriptional regulator